MASDHTTGIEPEDTEQQAALMRFAEGSDYDEIAERLGVTLLTARMLVSAGAKRAQEVAGT
jgi:DNA-directed RNA polymerase specialized sigma24 family protein